MAAQPTAYRRCQRSQFARAAERNAGYPVSLRVRQTRRALSLRRYRYTMDVDGFVHSPRRAASTPDTATNVWYREQTRGNSLIVAAFARPDFLEVASKKKSEDTTDRGDTGDPANRRPVRVDRCFDNVCSELKC